MHSVVIWEDIIFSGSVLQGAGKPFYRKVGFLHSVVRKRCFCIL